MPAIPVPTVANLDQVDGDNDGIGDVCETITDPDDADSDDDGLLDGEEDWNRNGILDPGETDPSNPDTDNDGLQDGTEIGLTVADVTADTDLAVFIPDDDPTTLTDPERSDTDNDGMGDGWGLSVV